MSSARRRSGPGSIRVAASGQGNPAHLRIHVQDQPYKGIVQNLVEIVCRRRTALFEHLLANLVRNKHFCFYGWGIHCFFRSVGLAPRDHCAPPARPIARQGWSPSTPLEFRMTTRALSPTPVAMFERLRNSLPDANWTTFHGSGQSRRSCLIVNLKPSHPPLVFGYMKITLKK